MAELILPDPKKEAERYASSALASAIGTYENAKRAGELLSPLEPLIAALDEDTEVEVWAGSYRTSLDIRLGKAQKVEDLDGLIAGLHNVLGKSESKKVTSAGLDVCWPGLALTVRPNFQGVCSVKRTNVRTEEREVCDYEMVCDEAAPVLTSAEQEVQAEAEVTATPPDDEVPF